MNVVDSEWGVLLNEATPQLYAMNPFRILGLPVDASPRVVRIREQELMILETMGFPPEEMARRFTGILPCNPPPDEEKVRDALHKLNEPDLRLVEEFFWFWPVKSDQDEEDAELSSMRQGEYQLAINRWTQLAGQGDTIAAHNLAVLYHAMALDIEQIEEQQALSETQDRQKYYYWKEAYANWNACIHKDYLWNRVADRIFEIDDPRITSYEMQKLRRLLPAALLKINAALLLEATRRRDQKGIRLHNSLIRDSGFEGAAVEDVFRTVIEPLRAKIKLLCTAAEKEVNATPKNGAQIARRLLHDTREILELIDMLLAAGDPVREDVHDEIAQQLISCTISYVNETDDWQTGLNIMEEALPIAASQSSKDRVQQNIDIIKRNLADTVCWFCGTRQKDEPSAIPVEMHGDVRRVPEWNGVRVHWRNLTIKVPRCKQCAAQHNKFNAMVGILIVVWIALGGLVYMMAKNHLAAFIVSTVVCIVAAYFGDRHSHQNGSIKADSQAKEYTVIKQLEKEGWKIGAKPEGVQ